MRESKNLTSRAIEILRKEGVKIFFVKVLAYMAKRAQIFILPFVALRIRHFGQKCTPDELVNLAFEDFMGLIKPMQIRSEISELLKIVDRIKPKVILEIGTANGGTLFLLSRVVSKDATIISIDLPRGRFGGGYSKWRSLLYKSFALPNQKIHLLRLDSHKKETFEQVEAILGGRKLDFLFIDGDHTYEGVKRDFEMYSKLIERESNKSTRYSTSLICPRLSGRKILERNQTEAQDKRNNIFIESNLGSNQVTFHLKDMRIIAFHDIVPGPSENVGGTPQFWTEIKDRYSSEEIVQDWSQGGYGIGLLCLE